MLGLYTEDTAIVNMIYPHGCGHNDREGETGALSNAKALRIASRSAKYCNRKLVLRRIVGRIAERWTNRIKALSAFARRLQRGTGATGNADRDGSTMKHLVA